MPFLMANRNDLIFFFISWTFRKFNYEFFPTDNFLHIFAIFIDDIIEVLCYFVVFQNYYLERRRFWVSERRISIRGQFRNFDSKRKLHWQRFSPRPNAKRSQMNNKLLRDLLTINSSANHSLTWINVCSNFH